jgi:hypothetical protein
MFNRKDIKSPDCLIKVYKEVFDKIFTNNNRGYAQDKMSDVLSVCILFYKLLGPIFYDAIY